jgi:hypothetical protein
MPTARTLEAEWRQVLPESASTGAKEEESGIWRVWAARFHHVMARSRLASVLKLNEHYISLIFQVLFRAAVNRGYCISRYRDTSLFTLPATHQSPMAIFPDYRDSCHTPHN